MKKSIAVAKGDGIGSEIMDVVINIFKGVGVPLNYNYVEMGRDVFLAGHKLGMTPEAKKTVEELGILFKGPMETPKGGGNRSINVTARKMWGTFANCRVFKTIPGVETIFSKAGIPINLTIIRENLEDTYGGVEHLVSADLAISRKFTSAPGSYQLCMYAFEYAKKNGITSVACGHKANIMKLTDGMFLEIFYEVAKNYPEIKASDVIVDDLCMKLTTIPDQYQMVVLPNLQGDIVSDLCAGLIGGLGFAPSSNIGSNVNIFEAVHGTAPDIAGKGLANPTALLLSGLMMLNHLGFGKIAKKIELATLEVLQAGIHTKDLAKNKPHVSTKEYGDAIIEHALKISDSHPEVAKIQDIPTEVKTAQSSAGLKITKVDGKPNLLSSRTIASKCVGVDLFLESSEYAEDIAKKLLPILPSNLKLEVISNRGIGVYPEASLFTECINSYIIRLVANSDLKESEALKIASNIAEHFKILSLEMLRKYEKHGEKEVVGYSLI